MSREIEGKWGQENIYDRFCRVEVMRYSDEKNAKRLSKWYWRRNHHALGQRDFPIMIVSDRNRKIREVKEEVAKTLLTIVATVAWLIFTIWLCL